MNILFVGPTELVSEWISLSDGHRCFVLGKTDKLSSKAKHVDDLNEIDDLDLVLDLHVEFSKKRRKMLRAIHKRYGSSVNVLTNSVAITATDVSEATGLCVQLTGVAALPGLLESGIVELCRPYDVAQEIPELVLEYFSSIGKRSEHVADEVGMVFPRIISMIVNEAVIALQQGVADEDAIDTAMKLGVNYPLGPFAWGKRLGFANVYTILRALHAETGDDRYRPATLMKKMGRA